VTAILFSFSLPAGMAAEKPVTLAYVEWSDAIASTHLVQAVIQEKLGRDCEIHPMQADEMWQAVADGSADAMVAAWLPTTHGHYYDQVADRIEDLGPNLEGTRIGLVVPAASEGPETTAEEYIPVTTIPGLKEKADLFSGRIVGIDPEAGIMKKTLQAMEAYGLSDYELTQGSENTMAADLSNAIRREKAIVITGWKPHWMFARWELRFLEDPKKIYGEEERINTIVRKGLKEEMPEIYAFLDKFHWTPDDMAQLMIWIQEEGGLFTSEKALRFMKEHPDLVASWLP
jgi:glycine betaine/proline transport system substrate-binding protein